MKYRQNGAALIVGLIILMVLSLLGITSMQNSILEEKMSGNLSSQERAFQAAETGLSRAINHAPIDMDSDNDEQILLEGDQTIGSGASKANYLVTGQLGGNGSMPRGSGYSAIRFSATHGVVRCTSCTPTGARVALKQGFYQVGPKR